MNVLILASLLFTGAPTGAVPCLKPAVEVPALAPDDALRAYWESGLPFRSFLAEATRRKALWDRNYQSGEVPEELVRRARAIGGTWYLLAIAVDSCSDSVNTIPYLALLTEAVPGLDMRVVDPERARALMEARPTADGRAATPTVVLLDADFEDAGCFIERPRSLKEWIAERDGRMSREEIYQGKMGWYDQDAGASTLAEVVGLLEAAAAGAPRCQD